MIRWLRRGSELVLQEYMHPKAPGDDGSWQDVPTEVEKPVGTPDCAHVWVWKYVTNKGNVYRCDKCRGYDLRVKSEPKVARSIWVRGLEVRGAKPVEEYKQGWSEFREILEGDD